VDYSRCDPRWIYGLPITLDSLIHYAREKAPECFYEGHRSHTSILVIEKFERHFGQIINTDVAIDIFDPDFDFDTKLVLILQEEHPRSTKLTLEDEDYLRKELGIKEKGKWYRYFGSFVLEHLEDTRRRFPALFLLEQDPPTRTSVRLDALATLFVCRSQWPPSALVRDGPSCTSLSVYVLLY